MRSSRARVGAAVVVIAAAIAALMWWHGGTKVSRQSTRAGSGGVTVSPGPGSGRDAADPGRWLAPAGVAGRRIAGTVVGEDGVPIAGATVRLASRLTDAGLAPSPSKVTDAAGRFDLGTQLPIDYIVSAESADTTATLKSIDLRDPHLNPPPEELRLVLHPCIASIHGTVYDSTEGPIRGAIIARVQRRTITHVAALADQSGSYQLCVPVGGADIAVSADGYATHLEHVDVYGRMRHDFRLVPGAAIVGRVVRAADKSPVAGAIVEVTGSQQMTDELRLATASDSDGKFHFDAVSPGRHFISAEADHLVAPDVSFVAELGPPGDEIVCEMVPAMSIAGHVVDKANQKGAAGVSVFLKAGTGLRMSRGEPLAGVSQDDGAFIFERITPGDYAVVAGAGAIDEKPKTSVHLDDKKDVTGVVVEVEATASIDGRVVADGKPVEGAFVRAGNSGTSSDADGRFTLRGLEGGELTLYAESQRIGAFARDKTITLAPGEHKTGVEITLDLSASISGIVVDQKDAPVAGAFLEFSLLHGQDGGQATTADDGTFTARTLSGGGDYVFEVKQGPRSPLVYPPVTGKRHPPVAVADGKTHVTGVRVKIRVDKLAIGGRVTNAAGAGLPDVRVTATPKEVGWFQAPSATTDETGAFSIKDLLAGTYTIRAIGGHGEARVANVSAGTSGVVLKLLGPGRLTGTWKGFSTPPAISALRTDGMEEISTAYTATVTGSAFAFEDLPAGRYQVSARGGADRVSKSVDLAGGESKTLTLTAGEVGTIAGTVVDGKSKAPVAGMRCAAGPPGDDIFDTDGSSAGVRSDARGAFRIERVTAGPVVVACVGEDAAAWEQATVTVGQTTHVEMTSQSRQGADDDKVKVGLTFENQLEDVLVQTVAPGGAAARAGVAVGDVVTSINGEAIDRDRAGYAMFLVEHAKESTLVLERDNKQLTVVLKPDP